MDALNFRLSLEIQDFEPDSAPTTFNIEEFPKKKVGTIWAPRKKKMRVKIVTGQAGGESVMCWCREQGENRNI